MTRSHDWHVTTDCWKETLGFHHIGLSIKLFKYSHSVAAGLPRNERSRRVSHAFLCFYDIVPKSTSFVQYSLDYTGYISNDTKLLIFIFLSNDNLLTLDSIVGLRY